MIKDKIATRLDLDSLTKNLLEKDKAIVEAVGEWLRYKHENTMYLGKDAPVLIEQATAVEGNLRAKWNGDGTKMTEKDKDFAIKQALFNDGMYRDLLRTCEDVRYQEEALHERIEQLKRERRDMRLLIQLYIAIVGEPMEEADEIE